MSKVSGMLDQTKRADTALSGSQQEESNDDAGRANSFLSHARGVSKKSLISQGAKSRSDQSSHDVLDDIYNQRATGGNVTDGLKSYPISQQDDQSNFDLTSMYGRKPTLGSSNPKSNKKAATNNASNPTQDANRMTKRDLVPPNNQYHTITSLNQFISNRFDFYAREYGEFF